MPILMCGKVDCVNAFQDNTYGRGMRVFNIAKNASAGLETLRCTVCKGEVVRTKKNEKPDDDKRKGKGPRKPTPTEVAKDSKEDKEVPAAERPGKNKKK